MTPNQAADAIRCLYGRPLDTISDCLRAFVKAPDGRIFCGGDFGQIEARIVAWNAGHEPDLEVFRVNGDIYLKAAFDIYKKDFTKDDPERQVGKASTLGLGFGGGVGAFQTMARVYNVFVEDAEADDIKNRWRAAHQEVVAHWAALEKAAINAVKNPNTVYMVSRHELYSWGDSGKDVSVYEFPYAQYQFCKKGSFLVCRLPSGRMIYWAYPYLGSKVMPWGKSKEVLHFWGVDSVTKKWRVQTTYGGKLEENVTQATARDLLAECMVRLDRKGWTIPMHVHDEVLTEMPEDRHGLAEELKAEMEVVPEWARGLPLVADTWTGPCFRK